MAVYRFSAVVIGRNAGRSATGAAAYRAAERILDERTGLTHDYTRKQGVLYEAILTPENAPEWTHDRARLWNAVEAAEKRKDAQLAREIQLSLPHELNDAQRAELVLDFVRAEFVSRGMIADIAIHAPGREGDDRNHHAHVMLTMRELTPEGFGPKNREWNTPALLEQWRERWADFQNRSLERAGSSERVDHRSLEAQGIDREPEPKLGPTASKMEREGKDSERGDELRAVWKRNTQRAELKREAEVIDLALEREKRREAQERQARDQQRQRDAAERQARQDAERRAEEARARAQGPEQGKFSAWGNRRRAEMQNRQLDEQGEIGTRFAMQKHALEDRLKRTYGEGRDKAEAILADIAARQQRTGFMRVVYRLSGQAGRDQYAAEGARLTLENIAQREGEQRGALARQQGEGWRGLQDRHDQERRELESRIRTAYERRERDGWRDPWAQENAREQGRPQATPEHEQDELKPEWTKANERANDNGGEPSRDTGTEGPDRGRERSRDPGGDGFD